MVDESLRASAKTSAKVRREIQKSDESDTKLAKRLGVNRKTVAKWKARDSTNDAPMGPKDPRSSLVNIEEEAIIIAYRRHTRLSLDDCLIRLRKQIPNLTRSTLHRCLRRNGVSKIGRTCVSQPLGDINLLKGFFCFEISREEIAFDGPMIGVVYSVFLAVSTAN